MLLGIWITLNVEINTLLKDKNNLTDIRFSQLAPLKSVEHKQVKPLFSGNGSQVPPFWHSSGVRHGSGGIPVLKRW